MESAQFFLHFLPNSPATHYVQYKMNFFENSTFFFCVSYTILILIEKCLVHIVAFKKTLRTFMFPLEERIQKHSFLLSVPTKTGREERGRNPELPPN